MPWRNGGGVTRELLAWPLAVDWRVRLSVAEVARDGPFSRFDGVRRWFAVLSGAGVQLVLDGELHRLTPDSEAISFDGAAAVDCTLLGGPTLDFNLMTRGHDARMRRVRGAWTGIVRPGVLLAAWNGEAGPATLRLGRDTLTLERMTLAWCVTEEAAPLRFDTADGLWMEVAP